MRSLALALPSALLFSTALASEPQVPEHRAKLYRDWKKLPEPPITPYEGPFGPSARAFPDRQEHQYIAANKDNLTEAQVANLKAISDYRHTAQNGVYDPKLDPRPINREYEKAILEDWNRMGYNCAYKGNCWFGNVRYARMHLHTRRF